MALCDIASKGKPQEYCDTTLKFGRDGIKWVKNGFAGGLCSPFSRWSYTAGGAMLGGAVGLVGGARLGGSKGALAGAVILGGAGAAGADYLIQKHCDGNKEPNLEQVAVTGASYALGAGAMNFTYQSLRSYTGAIGALRLPGSGAVGGAAGDAAVQGADILSGDKEWRDFSGKELGVSAAAGAVASLVGLKLLERGAPARVPTTYGRGGARRPVPERGPEPAAEIEDGSVRRPRRPQGRAEGDAQASARLAGSARDDAETAAAVANDAASRAEVAAESAEQSLYGARREGAKILEQATQEAQGIRVQSAELFSAAQARDQGSRSLLTQIQTERKALTPISARTMAYAAVPALGAAFGLGLMADSLASKIFRTTPRREEFDALLDSKISQGMAGKLPQEVAQQVGEALAKYKGTAELTPEQRTEIAKKLFAEFQSRLPTREEIQTIATAAARAAVAEELRALISEPETKK